MRTIQIRTNYNPWLSQLTKDMMSERDRLHKLAAETQDSEDWKKFKVIRNKINNRLKSEEKDWQRSKINDCGDDSKKLWKNIKNILNWNSSGSPSQLFFNGQLVTKPQEVARTQNEFFLSKVEQIIQNLPSPISDPLRSLMVGRICTFRLSEVHPV